MQSLAAEGNETLKKAASKHNSPDVLDLGVAKPVEGETCEQNQHRKNNGDGHSDQEGTMVTDSQKLKDVRAWARGADMAHRATDKRFNNKVHIVHEDGSVFVVMDAFLEEKDEYVIVYAEHHDTLIFPKEDLLVCQEYPQKLKDICVGEGCLEPDPALGVGDANEE